LGVLLKVELAALPGHGAEDCLTCGSHAWMTSLTMNAVPHIPRVTNEVKKARLDEVSVGQVSVP